MRKALLIPLFLLASVEGFNQSFREQFTEANLLMEDGIYGLAIPLWKDLLKDDPGNANLNYKLGRCYLSMGIDRNQALPYLVEASRDVRNIYDPFSADFKGAPLETFYYLALANHINTQLDDAEHYYNQFLEKAGKKHFLRPAAERGLEMCATARELMADPLDVDIRNIGAPINSPYAEYTPIVAYDENTLYFTSRRLRSDSTNKEAMEAATGLFYEDMYVSYRSIRGNWAEPELLPINVPDAHSSVVSMSSDGQTLYIYKTFGGNGNIYESIFRLGEGWTTPALVGSDINTAANEFFATITADKQRLYFVSDRKGGEGGKDIWYAQRLPNGDWGKALNAGPVINTPYDEDAPFLHPDGKTMYFSSTGHRSMGGYDIFYTQMDTEGQWSPPRNLGYPVNSTDDDHSYISTPSGKRAYYSSRGENSLGSTDIYVVEYHEEEEKAPEVDLSTFAVLKGWVFPPMNEELPDSLLITVTDKATMEVKGEARPVKHNGSFVFIIPSGASYEASYMLGQNVFYREEITIPPGTKYQELSREIFLAPASDGTLRVIALRDEVLGDVVRWRLNFSGSREAIPLGSRVLYLDGDSNVLDTAYVSKDGYFEFRRLDSDQNYILQPVVEGTDNTNLQVVLVDRHDEVRSIDMIQVNSVFYEKGKEPVIVERRISVFQVSIGNGKVEIPAGTVVRFLDANGKVVYTEIVREDGTFLYHKLEGDLDYALELHSTADLGQQAEIRELSGSTIIRIIPLSGKDGRTFVSHPGTGEVSEGEKTPVKKEVSEYRVVTGPGISIPAGSIIHFLDEHDNVVYTEVIRDDGSFVFHKLSDNRDYKLQLIATGKLDGEPRIAEIQSGETVRHIALYRVAEGSFSSSPTLSLQREYTFLLDYNEVLIPEDDPQLTVLVEALRAEIETRGKAMIALEGSASHVPTTFEGGNEALARVRREEGKSRLFERLRLAGVDINRISTISQKSMVQGPEYELTEYPEKSLFIGYQYFRVTIN